MSAAGSTRLASTRSALVGACRTVVALKGLRGLTMSGVADASGLARATVYNHVRDREELLAVMTIAMRTEFVSLAQSHTSAREGLAALAHWIALGPALNGLREFNAQSLVGLASAVVAFPEDIALEVMNVLGAWGVHSDLSAAEAAIRWLSSYLLAPGTASERETGADLLAASLSLDLVR